jgi:RimJ/RimL family protein N-acetyltransferase
MEDATLHGAAHRAAGIAPIPAPGPRLLRRLPIDPETARYQSWQAPYQPSQARQFLQELAVIHPDTPGEWFQFAVALRHTDRLIGDCGAHVQAEDPRQAEAGGHAPRGPPPGEHLVQGRVDQ